MTPLERRGLLIQLRPHFKKRARLLERIERTERPTIPDPPTPADRRWTKEQRETHARLLAEKRERRQAMPKPEPAIRSRVLVEGAHRRHVQELTR